MKHSNPIYYSSILDLDFTKYPDDVSSVEMLALSERVTTQWFCMSCRFSYRRANSCHH